ncbi:MAG: DUF2946 domain-containing protein [Colwellia sp.]
MKNTWLSFLLILSIALQSFVAVANSDENHQVDIQHIQTEHSHDVDNIEYFDGASEEEHNIEDCHHCGHCQGSHTQWFTNNKTSITPLKFLITNQYLYFNPLDKGFIEELIRPPIA